jgi:hypothetical protein
MFPSLKNFPVFQSAISGASKQSLLRHTRDPLQAPAGAIQSSACRLGISPT